jgi:dipeptidyl aminopeptidase/acylaminoacyl peptidase
LLGSPLTGYNTELPLPKTSKEFIAEDDMGKIYRIQLEVMDDFIFYGLLFLPRNFDETKKYPYIISQHGGGGTPELCSDFYFDTNYTHMTRRVLEKNAVVFAPQLLLWDKNNFKAEYDRKTADNSLKQFGSGITALEVFCIMRSTDYFAAQPYIDAGRIGMIGLSYGGLYTMVTAAADTRIKSAYSSCFFNDRLTYSGFECEWFNAAHTFLDAEMTALVAPRRLYIEAGKNDQLFRPETATAEYERLVPFFEAAGAADNLRFNVFEGDHMLDRDDSGLDFFIEGLL